MKIASLEDPFPYGTCMTGHRSATERSRALPKNVRFAVAMSTCAIGLDRRTSAIAARRAIGRNRQSSMFGAAPVNYGPSN
jgi:hypothetical protein